MVIRRLQWTDRKMDGYVNYNYSCTDRWMEPRKDGVVCLFVLIESFQYEIWKYRYECKNPRNDMQELFYTANLRNTLLRYTYCILFAFTILDFSLLISEANINDFRLKTNVN